jgi:hypothetical protein
MSTRRGANSSFSATLMFQLGDSGARVGATYCIPVTIE